jgi:AcrR family transcriptional regulator
MSEGAHTTSLRERKRLAAMRRIQEIALDLFDRDGYVGVTIERIAAAADVSPSSVYRYFGTKEQIVLWDEYDPIWFSEVVEGLHDRPPIEAIRFAVNALLTGSLLRDDERIRRRIRYVMTEPSIEAASTLQTHQTAEAFGTALSAGLGRAHGDLEVQLFSHAIIGAIVGAMHHWYESDFTTPLPVVLDRVFASFERGFGLTEQSEGASPAS